MLYHLARALLPKVSALNVLTYHTVRAGGAAVTGFLFCLLFGPWIIRQLGALKVGQFIKKEHVADLHELHQGKAGTPTMGGTMIIMSTTLSLLLWSTLTNRLMWVALGVFIMLGVVGFVDDYIKLKRKHNDGLSARAKFFGQVLTGMLLGLYLVGNPIAVSATYVTPTDVLDWDALTGAVVSGSDVGDATPSARIWSCLTPEAKKYISKAAIDVERTEEALAEWSDNGKEWSLASKRGLITAHREAVDAYHFTLLEALNMALANPGFYAPESWADVTLGKEARKLAGKDASSMRERDLARLNRLLVEAAFPAAVAESIPNLHTRVGIPGFKDAMIPMGMLYVFFVIIIIVSVSNAVNLTDGLDGLAAGASIISIMTYAAIAYVVSRADWSTYLYLIHIPEASELFVFGGALLGTGLGFLWFNCHPAEVFMGDTGSLALGGAIGTLAILTKQELLLPIVAGLFVLEALSVVIQVGSFKLTGKRVFRMAPLHHHFELLGWSETKVSMRFWIIAVVFALMSLATLKLR